MGPQHDHGRLCGPEQGSCQVWGQRGKGGGGEEAGGEGGSAVLRAERILFFPQSVAPVPVWQMTLGENQGNEVGIAQAQEKGHKANNVGSVQEEMGTAGLLGRLRLQESGSPRVTPAQAVQEGRGPRPRGGETQREQGRATPARRGCSLRRGIWCGGLRNSRLWS